MIGLNWQVRGPDPKGRASWEVFARRWLLIGISLGYVNAKGREHALLRARERWPKEKHLFVQPKSE